MMSLLYLMQIIPYCILVSYYVKKKVYSNISHCCWFHANSGNTVSAWLSLMTLHSAMLLSSICAGRRESVLHAFRDTAKHQRLLSTVAHRANWSESLPKPVMQEAYPTFLHSSSVFTLIYMIASLWFCCIPEDSSRVHLTLRICQTFLPSLNTIPNSIGCLIDTPLSSPRIVPFAVEACAYVTEFPELEHMHLLTPHGAAVNFH